MEPTAAPRPAPAGELDLVIVGGCGHVGLPLALSFADVGCRVGIYDTNAAKVEQIRQGQMPFQERGADALLTRLLPTGRLVFSTDPAIVGRSATVVLVVGTPIDEFMNPSLRGIERAVAQLLPHLRSQALLILRSTVYPGTTSFVEEQLRSSGHEIEVACCPERIAEGYALEELRELPQLVGASTDRAFARASDLFTKLDLEIVRTTPDEAELAKLLTNTWRYMKFAIANQFFQIAHRAGLDYERILHAIRHNYPRAKDLPGPGFAAGPCLVKDAMQLAAFTPDHFPMGQAAMLINEGLPAYIVDMLNHRRPLAGRTIGVLGMAFKSESDDIRSSLSYKLKKLLAFRGAHVLCTDPYVKDDPDLVPLATVLQKAEVIIIGAPHSPYKNLQIGEREVVDIWGVLGAGISL
ncbi:MAG: nucleotide sugar dehydrogenase [Candidatus Dormibacter sp.]